MAYNDPQVMFKTAAILYGISAPAHMYMGFDAVYPALRKIPLVGRNAAGQRGAENCWNYVIASLLMAAAMNWQWARTGGPQTTEEYTVFWLIAGIHGINGFRYAQVGEYATLGPMWLGPLISYIALRAT